MLWRRRTRLDEEVASHLAQETADNIARGMDPAAARSAAIRAFGNVNAAKEKVRELDPLYWIDTLCQDIRFALRLIARSRWLSATIVATLTAGIAINVSYQELESRVRDVPGVVHTSFTSTAPWSGLNPTRVLEIDGQPIPATRDYRQDPARRVVSSDYFATLEIALTRGRGFTHNESSSTAQAVPTVISEAMARRYWPGQDPVGHTFRIAAVHQVIGVCRNVQGVTFMRDDGPFYYSPLDPHQSTPPYMLVRVSGDTRAAAAAVREIVRQLDPQMAATVATLASIVERQGERLKPVLIQGAIAGLFALLLALSGVYAVVSFSVKPTRS